MAPRAMHTAWPRAKLQIFDWRWTSLDYGDQGGLMNAQKRWVQLLEEKRVLACASLSLWHLLPYHTSYFWSVLCLELQLQPRVLVFYFETRSHCYPDWPWTCEPSASQVPWDYGLHHQDQIEFYLINNFTSLNQKDAMRVLQGQSIWVW